MNIKIAEKPYIDYKNVYVLTILFMHGDADEYTNEKATFEDESSLIKAIEVLKKYEGESNYNNLKWPDFEEVFGEGFIPWDATSGMNFRTIIDRIESVFWYNEHGVKYKVDYTS